jgi:uncharacterized LabA/DUF88 family protein
MKMNQQKSNNHPIKHPDQRVGVFIDVQNLYYSARHLYQKKVDFGTIVEDAVAGRRLIRAIAYVVRADAKEEQSFFDALYERGIETREKEIQTFAGGNQKADWDVGLAVDAIRLAPSLDTVVIVSGDGDYAPLVEYIQKGLGKQVEVMAFGASTSNFLTDIVDDFTDLSEQTDRYLIKSSRTASGSMRKKWKPKKKESTV